eukprot:scaffold107_cov269-Chaetoceros_neogracile.AAC.32
MSTEDKSIADQVKAVVHGCGQKLLLTIVSDTFDKVPLIQRHRRVQKTLNEAGFGMDQVHAITIKAWTVQQYKKKLDTA